MLRGKSVMRHTNKIDASSSSSTSDDHESLGAKHKQTPDTQAATLIVGSSSVMLPCWGVPSEQDLFTRKYIDQ